MELGAIPTRQLEELVSNPLAAQGFWEQGEDGQRLFREQQALATRNLDRASRVLHGHVPDVERMRSDLKSALEAETNARVEFDSAQAQMNLATHPFSRLGIQEAMQTRIRHADERSKALELQLVQGNVDINQFVREFREERMMRYICLGVQSSLF